jgi:type II secretory pathway pseudopilin PulG
MDFGVLAGTLANLSWREVLVAVIAVLALYVVVAFLRMRHLKRARALESDAASVSAQAAVAAYAAEQSPAPPAVSPPDLPSEPKLAADRGFPWNEPPPEIPGQQQINALVRDLAVLRGELGTLRADLSLLREEQQREFSNVRAAQNVSPLYSDAMQMAMQGHDANTISQHCGIARAESELVVALVRNRNDGN